MESYVKGLTSGEIATLSRCELGDISCGVRIILQRNSPGRIAVHTSVQEKVGRNIAEIAAREFGSNPSLVEFEMIPEDAREIFWPGSILE